MHYGTFPAYRTEPIEEPLQFLAREEALLAGRKVSDKIVVLEEGVTRFF